MVFQFEHVGLDHGPGGKFDVRPLRLLDLKASLGRWQAGLGTTRPSSLRWSGPSAASSAPPSADTSGSSSSLHGR